MEVPADAWQEGPWNRWSYQHVDEVVAVDAVARDRGRMRAWSSATGGLDDLVDPLVADVWWTASLSPSTG
jgi:hypothetical protein